MKRCLKCGQSYVDETLNYCLNDGEPLVRGSDYDPPPTEFADDAPATLVMNQPRVTNPVDWGPSYLAQQQGIPPAQNPHYGMAGYGEPKNQTLAAISLGMSIASIVLVCCLGGVLLGLPAAVVGFIAMKNVDTNPAKYTGRGMAMAGMVIGIITFVMSVFFVIFGKLS